MVTGGALVRLMAVIWVWVVTAVVVLAVVFTGFSVTNEGLSVLSGQVGGPSGGGGGPWPVVLEAGCLSRVGAGSLGFGAGGRKVEGGADDAGGLSSPV